MNREPTSGYGWSYGADIQKDGSFDLANMWSSTFCLTVMTAKQEILGWIPIVIPKEDMEGVRIAANAEASRRSRQATTAPLSTPLIHSPCLVLEDGD